MSHHDSIGYKCGRDLSPSKPPPVQSLDGFLCRINGVELQIYLALLSSQLQISIVKKGANLAIFLDLDSINLAILILAFAFDIVSKIRIPITLCFSANTLAGLRC